MIARITAAAVTAATLLVPHAAHAAAPSPWKVVKRTSLAGEEQFTQFAAGGDKAAWAFGLRTGSTTGELLSYHFDGRKWRSAPLPKGVKKTFDLNSFSYSEGSLSASSPSNAWTYSDGVYSYPDFPPPDGDCPSIETPFRTRVAKARAERIGTSLARARGVAADGVVIKKPAKVLRWSGGRWKTVRALKDVIPWVIKARGAKEALLFGENVRTGKQVMLRFDGRRWRSTNTPVVLDAVVEGKNVWVSSFDKTFKPEVYRWNGGSWTSARYGRAVPDEVAPTKDRDGVSSFISSLTVRKGKLTILGETWRGPLCPTKENLGSQKTTLLTGGNGSWRPVTTKGLKGWNATGLSSDGRGGHYLTADNYPRTPVWEMPPGWTPQRALFHKTATGSWRREVLPKSVIASDLPETTPGSRTLWLTGAIDGRWDIDAVVLRRR